MNLNDLADAEEARLFGQYRNAWKHLVGDAPGCGAAAEIDADGELTRDTLADALEWVDHKAGDLSDHTLVAHPVAYDTVTAPKIVGEGHYWTGDSGMFDSGEVVSVTDDQDDGDPAHYGPVRVRWDPGIYPEAMAVVELDHMTLTGDYPTFTHERGMSGEIETTTHPYAVITGLPHRDDWPRDDDPQAMAADSEVGR
jgi:hypothetical protein